MVSTLRMSSHGHVFMLLLIAYLPVLFSWLDLKYSTRSWSNDIMKQGRRSCSVTRLHSTASSVADELHGWDTSQVNTFLETYWQKRPVLIRQAFPAIEDDIRCLTEADFFELSQDEDVESRTLVKDGDDWTKEYGPFDRKYLRKLASNKQYWTMLIQEVDRHIPSITDLWQKYFNFIPSWRRDDIMVSYAALGGGIGAHVDNYDVFLIQGRGKREWAIENAFVSAEEELAREVPNVDTRLLKGFIPDQVWELQAGDVLYLPPRIPHRGVSLGGNCTTVSMGFRSPAHRSMVTALCDYICQNTIPEKLMYADPTLQLQSSTGMIGNDARECIRKDLRSHIMDCLDEKSMFNHWFGKYLTVPLRMQLRKPRAFFLNSEAKKRSLRSALVEYGLTEEVLESQPGNNGLFKTSNYEDEDEDLFDDDDDEDDMLPISLRLPYRVASERIFLDSNEVIDAMIADDIVLRRCEGTKLSFTEDTLFVDGDAYSFPRNGHNFGPILCDTRMISRECFVKHSIDLISRETSIVRFLRAFIDTGYFYPVDK